MKNPIINFLSINFYRKKFIFSGAFNINIQTQNQTDIKKVGSFDKILITF